MKSVSRIKQLFKKGTLRRTLIIYLLIACLIPPSILAGYTYSSMHSILQHKISAGIEASLRQEAMGIENLLSNLDFVSKQFALDGQTAARVNEYMSTTSLSEKVAMIEQIEATFNVVNFTNPNVGLMVYYHENTEQPILFNNLSVREDININELPLFVRYNGTAYYGPHQTQYKNSENIVFSSIREVRSDSNDSLYIYLESNYNMFRKMMNNHWYGMPVHHYLISDQKEVLFADANDPPIAAEELSWELVASGVKQIQGHYLFGYESIQGWKLVIAVNKDEYNREINAWFLRMVALVLGSLILALIIAMMIWRKVYGSLRRMNLEIIKLTGERESPVKPIGIEEFDTLLYNFQGMKHTVNELIAEVSQNERNKSQLEIEKLLSQINPHFLHNTLNTVQWIARAKGQDDIDRIVTLLVKLLHYNMGKSSLIVTIRQELEALQHYIDLHKIRYEDELSFKLDIDEQMLDVNVPRFLLQPLVENAIYHGRGEEHSVIAITIRPHSEHEIMLKVEDNGRGVDRKILEQLLPATKTSSSGMGIGLSYVRRLLERFYGGRGVLQLESMEGVGTSLTVIIPNKLEEERHD